MSLHAMRAEQLLSKLQLAHQDKVKLMKENEQLRTEVQALRSGIQAIIDKMGMNNLTMTQD